MEHNNEFPLFFFLSFIHSFFLSFFLSFLPSFFLSYSDLRLPTHCRCRGLLSHLITLNDTHTHTRCDSSGRVICPSQRPPPDKTQHLQEREASMPPGGIRTHNPSKRAAADPRLRTRGHRDRHTEFVVSKTTSEEGK